MNVVKLSIDVDWTDECDTQDTEENIQPAITSPKRKLRCDIQLRMLLANTLAKLCLRKRASECVTVLTSE